MKIFESLFDITYLILVVSLGVRLLLENKKGAKLFGVMAILLGLGDSFHLLPRIISHLSPGGFEAHAAALSWGQFVTSITMTIFYVMFYHFYSNQTGDKNKTHKWLIYILALIRIILVLMPQNNWGQAQGNYMFGIYRNIPFAIMGALLIFWSYREKEKAGMKKMWLLILLSFLFYIPVVLFSDVFPPVGAFMLPKTIAYLMIVVLGYKYFIGQFSSTSILVMAFTFLIMGLGGGVFYREFTKLFNYTDPTHLGKIHVHALVLGFVLLTLIYSLVKKYGENNMNSLKKPIYIYITGLTFTLVNMVLLGIYEVVSSGQNIVNQNVLNGISGMGHIILSVGLVWTIIILYRIEKEKE